MGRGTISLNNVPKKKKIYGDNDFHLRPIFMHTDEKGENHYCFYLRPSTEKEFDYDLEGEFGVGEKSFKDSKKESIAGEYKNTSYFYLEEDLDNMNKTQKKRILNWAKDGEI